MLPVLFIESTDVPLLLCISSSYVVVCPDPALMANVEAPVAL
jgi:hypothetical protein